MSSWFPSSAGQFSESCHFSILVSRMDCDHLQYLGWFNHQQSTNRAFKRKVEHCSFGSTDHTAPMALGLGDWTQFERFHPRLSLPHLSLSLLVALSSCSLIQRAEPWQSAWFKNGRSTILNHPKVVYSWAHLPRDSATLSKSTRPDEAWSRNTSGGPGWK